MSPCVGPPPGARAPPADDTLGLLLSGFSITDEQLVGASMMQMRQWAAYLPAAVTETLKRRRRQIKNRYYQVLCRRRRKQQHQAFVRTLQQSRQIIQQSAKKREPSDDMNADT
ncbi:hypothetical protein LSAT2_030017 [Lamellibrachia satsuma]|nr:hypothetical protein LSAT2_030017 [Lamellibrachia satsuma]